MGQDGTTTRRGPLAGLKIIELAGIGPAPVCASLLADHGAEVVRIEGPRSDDLGMKRDARFDVSLRGRDVVYVNLRSDSEREKFIQLAGSADALLDPLRPGAAERLGIGPDALLARNPRLVYARLTGWGQTGPWAKKAGHGINYLSITGALHAIGPPERPLPPLNLVADMGGGTMFGAFGVLAACLHAQKTGQGQVVDISMAEGAIYLSMGMFGLFAEGRLSTQRETNFVDGGAPNYCCYETKDGKYVAVGAAEQRFFMVVLERLGLDSSLAAQALDPAQWSRIKSLLGGAFKTRTRDEWMQHFAAVDACVTPVLDWSEAPSHPHNTARGSFVELDGIAQPAPVPKFSATPSEIQPSRSESAGSLDSILAKWGSPCRL